MPEEWTDTTINEKPACFCSRKKHILIFCPLFALACVACWWIHRPKDVEPKLGQYCLVQFRRDMLGRASDLPVSPTTNSINGVTVAIEGKLLAINRDAILIERQNPAYIINEKPKITHVWIPRSYILLIEFEPVRNVPI